MTDAELDQLVERLKAVDPFSEYEANPDGPAAADALAAVRKERDRMRDKVDGLETELESAVEVAFKRGAAEWTRLNYPEIYARQIARQALQGDTE